MTLQRLTTRLQRLEQRVGRQAQHTRFVLVEWREAEETYAEALARTGVDLADETQIVVVVSCYT